jgi:hypothetical protein
MIWIHAANGKRIGLATGISVASSRIARRDGAFDRDYQGNRSGEDDALLGFGTGRAGRRVMGLQKIRYPFHVATNGPQTLGLAGEFDDSIITSGVTTPERVAAVVGHAQTGAEAAGRKIERKNAVRPLRAIFSSCDQASPESPRLMRMVESVGDHLPSRKPRFLPPVDARAVYDEYGKYIEGLGTPGERYLDLHVGQCPFVPGRERRFITPATIRAITNDRSARRAGRAVENAGKRRT